MIRGCLAKKARLCSICFLGRVQPDLAIRLPPSKFADSDVRASCGATKQMELVPHAQ